MKKSLGLLVVLAAEASVAQPAAPASAEKLPLDVATVKLAAPNAAPNRVIPLGPTRISIPSMTLTWLIYTAYGEGLSTAVRVTGGPDWMNKTSYAVEIQAQKPSTQRQFHLMLRALLEERFALKIRTEIQMGDIYALVLARSDGKLGPNVEEWDGTCGGKPPAEVDDPSTPACFSGYRPAGIFLEGATMFSAGEVLSLPQSRALLGTIVEDQTGLKGRYKMHLDFPFAPQRPAQPDQAPAATPEFAAPSLFTAVREQWGLKLERAKGPLKVLLVENAQPPAQN